MKTTNLLGCRIVAAVLLIVAMALVALSFITTDSGGEGLCMVGVICLGVLREAFR